MIHPAGETDAGSAGEQPARDSRPGRRIILEGEPTGSPNPHPSPGRRVIQSSLMPLKTPTGRRPVLCPSPLSARALCPVHAEPVHWTFASRTRQSPGSAVRLSLHSHVQTGEDPVGKGPPCEAPRTGQTLRTGLGVCGAASAPNLRETRAAPCPNRGGRRGRGEPQAGTTLQITRGRSGAWEAAGLEPGLVGSGWLQRARPPEAMAVRLCACTGGERAARAGVNWEAGGACGSPCPSGHGAWRGRGCRGTRCSASWAWGW